VKRDPVTLLILGAVAVIAYKVWTEVSKTGKEANDAVVDAVAAFWLRLFPNPPAIQLLGNVAFPGNNLVPLQTLAANDAIRQDADYNVFVKWGGKVYQLQPSNADGNWPAVPVPL
jgi:hypothetical protein